MFAPLSGRERRMGSETRLEAPLGKGLLSPQESSALYWSSLGLPPYRCLWETTCLVYYEKSFYISLSLVLRREFKQTKWQNVVF